MAMGMRPSVAADVDLRSVMRLFPTGVAVLVSGQADEAVATTINSLTSVGLMPPTVLVSLRLNSRAQKMVSASEEFCLNFLSAKQEHLAALFASRVKPAGRELEQYFTGAPEGRGVLDGAIAALRCTVTTSYTAGDHCLVIGDVTSAHHGDAGHGTLLFHRGRMASV
ncbi:flavin reductase family protein [Streptomyces sp. NPDC052164]|uniref:flavin reductase family protein n=1 Tax=Streptomyces sp. NPDC052164 TaxID=3155529 RepID=UPI0034195064